MIFFRHLYRFLISLKLAVLVISGIAIALAVATVLESVYDTPTAQFWVYQSLWFYSLLGLLGLNILFVALSRWPWRWSHLPFLLAHLGILILLFGSLLTDKIGIDGSLRVSEGGSASIVELGENYLYLGHQNRLWKIPVPWIPPHSQFSPIDLNQHELKLDLRVDQYLTHADPEINFEEDLQGRDESREPALKIKLTGGPMAISQEIWLWKGSSSWQEVQAGPAVFQFGLPPKEANGPRIGFQPLSSGALQYRAIGSDGHVQSGVLKGPVSNLVGQVIQPGWKGDVQISIEKWIPNARVVANYHPSRVQFGQQAPPSAIHLISNRFETDIWLGLGDRAVVYIDGKPWDVAYFPKRVVLPFSVRLDRFKVDYDPGTVRPAAYSSRVTVTHEKLGQKDALISMNEPLDYQGFTFYQASYEDGDPRPTTSILSVNQDPGRFWKYFGSFLIVLGSIMLFMKKTWAKKKRSVKSESYSMARTTVSVAVFGVLLSSSFGYAESTKTQLEPKNWSFQEVSLTPIQAGGRVKPLDTYAREIGLFITGSRSFQGWNSVDLMLSWISQPDAWKNVSFVQVSRVDVRRQLGLSESETLFSPIELLENSALLQYANSIGTNNQSVAVEAVSKTDEREKELKSVLDRVTLFHQLISGEAWTLIPVPTPHPWHSLIEPSETGRVIREQFAELVQAYQAQDQSKFQRVSHLLRAGVEGEMSDFESVENQILAESIYNKTRPFLLAWIGYLVAFVFLLFRSAAGSRISKWVAAGALATAVSSHTIGMVLRSFVAGRPPVTNMYESVIWVSFGILVFGVILYSVYRQRVILGVASLLGCIALLVADAAPTVLDGTIQPLVPVLRSNFWLTIHVLTITLSYAAFALTFGLAHFSLIQMWRGKGKKTVQGINLLTYRSMQFGVVLIAAGTILGGIWADYSWGRFWGWDPKEVWALITLLCYLVILHGRFAGWIGPFGFAVGSAVAFMSVVMAWYGVNFILGAGLHSYGFASGGTPWVIGFLVLELAFLGFITVSKYRNEKKVS